MLELLYRIFIISLTANCWYCIAIDEKIPFVLIKLKDRLELPREVKLRTDYRLQRIKIDFRYSNERKQAFYCPAETEDQRKKIETANEIFREKNNKTADEISQNCLFEKKKKRSSSSMFPQCQQPFQPKMMKDFILWQSGEQKERFVAKTVHCGPSDLGLSLRFGYEICQDYGAWNKLKHKLNLVDKKHPFKLTTFNFYKVCYNAQKKEILYTFHQIKTPLLFDEYLLQKEEARKPDEMATNELMNMSEIDFEQVKLKLEKILLTNPKFKIQLLVPSEDLPFATWKIPVHHYVNASLINGELQQCWNMIYDRIRRSVIKANRRISIYTKAFEYFETSSAKNGYIDEIRIPTVWVKIVHDISYYVKERKAVAIIANNKQDDALDQIMWAKYNCEQNLCQNYIETFFRDELVKYIRCCQVTTEIQQIFGLNLTLKGILDIDDLIERVHSSHQESVNNATSQLLQIMAP